MTTFEFTYAHASSTQVFTGIRLAVRAYVPHPFNRFPITVAARGSVSVYTGTTFVKGRFSPRVTGGAEGDVFL